MDKLWQVKTHFLTIMSIVFKIGRIVKWGVILANTFQIVDHFFASTIMKLISFFHEKLNPREGTLGHKVD